jgi:hypothetical protein
VLPVCFIIRHVLKQIARLHLEEAAQAIHRFIVHARLTVGRKPAYHRKCYLGFCCKLVLGARWCALGGTVVVSCWAAR